MLLVEDNEINQLVVADLLAAAGIDVDIDDNGQVAVDKALASDSDRYSLILMDMHMPVMDGTDATRRIRALPGWSSIPIIALTANVMAGSREECLAAGTNDFLTKPIEPEALDGALRRWINAS